MAGVSLYADVGFGVGSAGTADLLAGFSDPEIGFCWAMGPESRFRVAIPEHGAAAIVVLHIAPFVRRAQAVGLAVHMSIDGARVFTGRIVKDTAVGLLCAGLRPGRTHCTITVTCDNAVRPADAAFDGERRKLTFNLRQAWVFGCDEPPMLAEVHCHGRVRPEDLTRGEDIVRLTGMAPDALVTSFESVGLSCDFGLFQREMGAEPVGLLRFTGLETVNLFRGLINRFAGLGDPGTIAPYIVESLDEYWMSEAVYGLQYHTFLRPWQASPQQLIARETHRLPFLARKLMEDVENGEKIFVMRPPDAALFAEAIAVWAALNVAGDNTLLYLTDTVPERAGEVDKLGPRLLRGHVTGPVGDVAPSVRVWLSLCVNAHQAIRT